MKKKVVSLLLVAAMVAGMVGCGSDSGSNADSGSSDSGSSSTGGSSSDAGTSDSGSSDAGSADAGEVERPASLKVMVDGTVFTQENGRAEFEAKLEELTGIDIEFIQPDHDAYFDNVGQTLANPNEWPDIIILSSTYYTSYAAQGVLWDMSEVYENSDLKARQDAAGSTSVIDGVRIDGALYGMPAARGNGCVSYVKKEWLDNVGLDVPTNYDEYIEMLTAFATQDPDGNGVDGDTYGVNAAGFIGPEAPWTNYLPEIYQNAHPSFYLKDDGTWADGFAEDDMKAVLERLNYCYENNLIDPTALTNGTADCRNKYYDNGAGSFGVFTYWAGTWATNLKTNLESNGQDGELIPLPPIAELGYYLDRIPPVWCITTKCENPEGAFKYFIETMQDGGDTQFLWTYGVEGVHWSTAGETLFAGADNEKVYEEGQFHMLENLETEGTQYTKAHIDPMLALVELANDPQESSVAPEARASTELFNANSRTADNVPSTDEMAMYNGDLQTLKNQLIANVTMGQMTVDEAYAQYESQHGAEWSQLIVDSLNAQY